jgi:tetraacyldisaccharide 4'-kinase
MYGVIIWLRNRLYDKKILKSSSFNFPIICVGNLAVGGTGKTPMVEYLIRLLKNDFNVATLSRGYKRKTKGFAIADAATTALEIGDEPMQFHQKFPEISVAVGEERLVAIPQLLHDKPATEVIILDDAFQHREVQAGINIILTAYNNLYTRDFILPAGDLRDVKSSMERAHIIVVTKCKSDMALAEKAAIVNEINPGKSQSVFFTEIIYGTPLHLFNKSEKKLNNNHTALLVCGIANPRPLKDFLTVHVHSYDMLRFADHHIFDTEDLASIKRHFDKISSADKIILTTEKDGVRLSKFEADLKAYPIYVLPIVHGILFEEEEKFNTLVMDFVYSINKIDAGSSQGLQGAY